MGVQFFNGVPVLQMNRVSDFKKFYISYNPSWRDYGSDTTAIVVDNSVFLILNGDHRKELDILAQDGIDPCVQYFINNISSANGNSEHQWVNSSTNVLSIRSTLESALSETIFKNLCEIA